MILSVENLVKHYPGRRSLFRPGPPTIALNGVSLFVAKGESFGIVGESGSGKTTLSRCILRLESITAGRVLFEGTDLTTLNPADMRRMRARLQIVFQDPYAALDPRMTIHDIIAEGMEIHADILRLDTRQRTDRVVELLELVGLGVRHMFRYPHEFSGGQRQRVGIARALATAPDLLILDEPTSALDVSVQAQVLNLLADLQTRLGLTYLFISHDLAVIRYICDRVALLHHGQVVEQGPTETIFQTPRSDYARMLLAAMPIPDPALSPFR